MEIILHFSFKIIKAINGWPLLKNQELIYPSSELLLLRLFPGLGLLFRDFVIIKMCKNENKFKTYRHGEKSCRTF